MIDKWGERLLRSKENITNFGGDIILNLILMTVEQNSTSENNNQRIYSDIMIYISTFFCGPLVAGYMMSRNFKVLGEKEKVAPTWIIAIASSLMLLIIALLTPNMSFVSDLYLSLFASLVTYFLIRVTQGKALAEHIKNGGLKYSWLRCIAIIGIWWTVVIGLILIAFEVGVMLDIEI